MSTKKSTAAPRALATVTYCDKTHAQRSLFMPGGRELRVTRGRLTLQGDDVDARAYLDARSDFEPLPPGV